MFFFAKWRRPLLRVKSSYAHIQLWRLVQLELFPEEMSRLKINIPTTGRSPFFLLMGYEPVFPVDVNLVVNYKEPIARYTGNRKSAPGSGGAIVDAPHSKQIGKRRGH